MSAPTTSPAAESGARLKIRVYPVRLRAWAPGKKPRQLWLLRRLRKAENKLAAAATKDVHRAGAVCAETDRLLAEVSR